MLKKVSTLVDATCTECVQDAAFLEDMIFRWEEPTDAFWVSMSRILSCNDPEKRAEILDDIILPWVRLVGTSMSGLDDLIKDFDTDLLESLHVHLERRSRARVEEQQLKRLERSPEGAFLKMLLGEDVFQRKPWEQERNSEEPSDTPDKRHDHRAIGMLASMLRGMKSPRTVAESGIAIIIG